MANTLICEIVTPDELLYNGEAVMVVAPAAEGDLGMMYQCSPLMSTLRQGVIRIKDEHDATTSFAVAGGYLEVDGHKAIMLASRAIAVANIDKTISKQRIANNKTRRDELEEGNPARAFAQREIDWQEFLVSLV